MKRSVSLEFLKININSVLNIPTNIFNTQEYRNKYG